MEYSDILKKKKKKEGITFQKNRYHQISDIVDEGESLPKGKI